jgi:hypothetical protein
MNAGLPGLGLGGLFFILTALLAPAIELARTIRGRSSAAAWATVGRQFAIAVAMIAAIELTLRVALALAAIGGVGQSGGGEQITVLPVAPLAITTVLLTALIATAKGCQLAARALERGLPARALAALTRRPRIRLRGATAAGSACLLLLVGAPELGPVSTGTGAPRDPLEPERASGAAGSGGRNALRPLDRQPRAALDKKGYVYLVRRHDRLGLSGTGSARVAATSHWRFTRPTGA